MSKATELLDELICRYCLLEPRRNKQLGPGQAILRLSEEKRKILSELTSDEVSNIRPDTIFLFQ